MDVSETRKLTIDPPTVVAETAPGDTREVYRQCDQCGASVDDDQRYCVVCGTHLRSASDPAARYFSQATGRSRAQRVGSTAVRSRPVRARGGGLGIALMLALIPVAAAIGVMAGRSSNNGDPALIRALSHHQGTVTVTSAARHRAPVHARVAAARPKPRGKAHARKSSPKSSASTKTAGKVISTTKYGSAQQISGFKATKSEKQQGAKVTQQVQKSTGKNYVNSQTNLPSQVVVP